MPKRPYPRYRHRHNAVLLAACRDPSQTQKEIAKATGYSPSQVSRILCSPDFQQVYSSLIKEIAAGRTSNTGDALWRWCDAGWAYTSAERPLQTADTDLAALVDLDDAIADYPRRSLRRRQASRTGVVAVRPAFAPPVDQSSSRMSGSLNRCGSFGRGSNILNVPDPTHFISAV
jgi:transcriptional regulator with XRE-family HTH domain